MVQKSPGNIHIRPMITDDLDEALEIERESFSTPWSRELFKRELNMPQARSFVAVDSSGPIVGYLCYWIVAEEVHILNLAIHPHHRRRGIASLLLRYGLDYSQEEGAREATLEVRRSNYKAIALYRNFHFYPQGIRRRYYSDTGEDALIMGRTLPILNVEQ